MNVKDLAVILDVKALGSFAAVARARDIDASSVSRTVAAVEADLGVRLFQRTTRRLTLTDAGAAYLKRIEPLIDALHAAADALSNDAEANGGTVRISAPISIGRALIVPHLAAFRDTYPQITLECLFSDQVIDLVGEGVDLAIRMAPAISGDLICTKLRQTRYRVVASSSWIAQNGAPATPFNMHDHQCILFALPGFRERWIFRDPSGETTQVPVRGKLLFSNGDSIVDAMLAGLGPALLTNHLVEPHFASGACVDLFPDHEVAATSFDTAAWIVYPSRRHLPQKTRTVIDFLKARLA